MKKRVATILRTAALTLGLAVVPAIASAGPFSPIEVEAYTCGPLDEPRVNEVYRLPDNGLELPFILSCTGAVVALCAIKFKQI